MRVDCVAAEVASYEAESACDEDFHGFSLVGWVVPVPRFARSRVVFFAVYQFRDYFRVVPGSSFFIWVLVIIELGGEVDEKGCFVSYGFESVPVVAGHPQHLQI